MREEGTVVRKAVYIGIGTDLEGRKDGLTGFSEAIAAVYPKTDMLNVGATGFNDGLYYDASAADIDQMKAVFEKIFKVMDQEQHLNMMTGRV